MRPGETLTAIAERNGTTVRELASRNKLDPSNVLLIGVTLVVPKRQTVARKTSVAASINRWSAHYGVSPKLARALAWQESGWQPHVRSSVGATGVMQVIPATRDFVELFVIGQPIPRTTDGNIRVGVAYLDHLLGEFDGNLRRAIGAYYQGPAAVRHDGLLPRDATVRRERAGAARPGLTFLLRRRTTVAAERERQDDPGNQRSDVDGFLHERVRPEALGSREILPSTEAGQDDDHWPLLPAIERPQDLKAVHPRHLEVEQHHVRAKRLRQFQRFHAVLCHTDDVDRPLLREPREHRRRESSVIVHDEHSYRASRRLSFHRWTISRDRRENNYSLVLGHASTAPM